MLAIILSAFEQVGSDAWKQVGSVQCISSLLCLHFLPAESSALEEKLISVALSLPLHWFRFKSMLRKWAGLWYEIIG